MAHSDCGIACRRAGKTVKSLRTRAIPERFCGGDSLRTGAISSVCNFTFTRNGQVAPDVSLCKLK